MVLITLTAACFCLQKDVCAQSIESQFPNLPSPHSQLSEPQTPKMAPEQSNIRERVPLKGSAQFELPIETPRMALPGRASMAPPKTYRGWLEQTHPGFSLHTSEMESERLVVISDKYDQAERTLESLGLPYNIMPKKNFDAYDLSAAQVVIIDCGPNNLSFNSAIKIRDFVMRGGYLLTTDWMIDRLDQHVFPGFIAWSGATNRQKMYEASIVGKHPALFRHAVTNGAWKMDIHCHLIRVFNKEKVRVLAVSDDLAQEDPDGLGALAVVFPFGRGYVMHMMAHFDRGQSIFGYELPDASPAIGISLRQAIAINFVVAGLSGTKL